MEDQQESQEGEGVPQEVPSQVPSPTRDEVAQSSSGNGQSEQNSSIINQTAEVKDNDIITTDGNSQALSHDSGIAGATGGQNRSFVAKNASSIANSRLEMCISSDSSNSDDDDRNVPTFLKIRRNLNLEVIDYDVDIDSDMDVDDAEYVSSQMSGERSLICGRDQLTNSAVDINKNEAASPTMSSSMNCNEVTTVINALDALAEPADSKRPSYLEKCKVCQQPADLVCGGCYRSAYCSEGHQKQDWELHCRDCVHYGLIRNPMLLYRGPFSIDAVTENTGKKLYSLKSGATAANQTLLEEKPFLICPWPRVKMRQTEIHLTEGVFIRNLSCFGCGKTLCFSWTRCQDCNLFLCSTQCLYISNHKKMECRVIQELAQLKSKKQDPRLDLQALHFHEDFREYLYMDIMIIRLIVKFSELRESMSPQEFAELWGRLDLIWKSNSVSSSCESRRYAKMRDNLEDYLRFSYNLLSGRRNLLLKLFSIIEMNSFSFELPFRRFRALCVVLGLASHSCVPNCRAYLCEPEMEKIDINQTEKNPNDLTIVLKSGRALADGTMLTFSYVPLIFGTEERRQILHSSRFIWCMCPRCIDPTECGTFTTNIKCPACQSAMLLPPKSGLVAMLPDLELHALMKANWECRGNCNKRPSMTFRRPTLSQNRLGLCPPVKHNDAINKMKGVENAIAKYGVNTIGGVKDLFITTRINNGNFYQSAILKLSEDIIRGTFFPLPDILADDLSEYTDQTLTGVVLAKQIYLEFMQKINPGFNFEGFPIANLELAENELLGRETGRLMYAESVNPVLRSAGRGCVRPNSSCVIVI